MHFYSVFVGLGDMNGIQPVIAALVAFGSFLLGNQPSHFRVNPKKEVV